MQNRITGSILALAILFLLPVVLAQVVERSGDATSPPNLSGVWSGQGRVGSIRGAWGFDEVAPMTPAAAEKYKALVAAMKDRADRRENENRNLLDPMVIACAPVGPLRGLSTSGFELIQTPGRVILLYELDRGVRHVWIDGRKHPENRDPTWMGHSIGWWEGDTLVVETVGINDLTWLDDRGRPHSEALRIVERYRRVRQDTLEVDVVYNDPEVYTRPWGGKLTFKLEPNGELLEWVLCEDRIREQLKSDACESGIWEVGVLCEERKAQQGQ